MRIGESKIGWYRDNDGRVHGDVYVIAELGVNHDGSVDRALEMVDAAAGAGADAVKVQVFDADRLLSHEAMLARYQSQAGEEEPAAMLRRLSLKEDELARIAQRAHERNLHAIATVFSLDLVQTAEGMGPAGEGWDAYKVASPDIINRPLIDALEATGRPLILSTGAATLQEVGRAVDWLHDAEDRLALLQCVSAYPTADEDAALEGITALARVFYGPIGYSDHTAGVRTATDAVSLGAAILEKHFTLDRNAKGPDHSASLEPAQFAEYVKLAHEAIEHPNLEAMQRLGARKGVLPVEEEVRRLCRQSIVTRHALEQGDTILESSLTIKRPGTGIEPWRLDEVIGRRVSRRIEADVPLRFEDVAQ